MARTRPSTQAASAPGRPAASGPPLALLLALAAALAAACYLGTLANGFVFDDHDLVVENPHIKSWSEIPYLFQAGWRPLKRLSLMVDYHLWGLDPRGFHLSNIAFHVLATLSLGLVARALGAAAWTSFLAAALFATHPVHTEAVAVVTHRKEMMATAFFCLALYAHLRARPGPRAWLLVFSLFLASLLSKEIVGAAFPLVLLAWEALYRPGGARARALRVGLLLVPLAGAVALILAVRLLYQGSPSLFPFFGARYIAEITGGELTTYPPVLATALRAFWVYVRLLLWPVGLSADHDLGYSAGAFDPWAVASGLGLAALAVVSLRLQRNAPRASFALLWIPLTLLPATNIVPLTPWFVAERFLYLPSAGFCLLLAEGLAALARPRPPGRTDQPGRLPAAAIAATLLLAYGAITVARNRAWKDDYTIWQATVGQNPRSLVGWIALNSLYQRDGRYEEAADAARHILALDPLNLTANTNLGEALRALGRLDQAAAAYADAARRYPNDGHIRNNLGNCLKALGRADEALEQYRIAAALDPTLAEPHVNIGAALARGGDYPGAAASFERAIAIDPNLAVGHFNLALVLAQLGDRDGARGHLRQVLALPGGQDLRPRVLDTLRRLDAEERSPTP